ncbi:MAG: alpha/beta hydrolase [Polyangiaceae bacterium]|nr:alpha/beta hydrolase [Polyangiaceae bacterium]
MQTITVGSEALDVTLLEATTPRSVVLFAVGGGGNPERHLPLLEALRDHGNTVIAPHFERMVSPRVNDELLLTRARTLRLALDAVARPGLRVAGVGHSIGAATLLALAGGRIWLQREAPLPIERDARLERLALLAPATDFFRPPGALDAVTTPILAWAGESDHMTPPANLEVLRDALGSRVSVDVRVTEGAGHFSFMHTPPPNTTEPLADRDAFLAHLTQEVCRFIVAV